eukprot:COSAG06_NODE_6597_length_2861_cov_1.888849_3_plen_104_part_00
MSQSQHPPPGQRPFADPHRKPSLSGPPHSSRVCAGRVGKTSLVVRYCKDEFNEKEQSTVQASHLTKRLTIGDCNVMLNVWVRCRTRSGNSSACLSFARSPVVC